jgi:hypothetical protein
MPIETRRISAQGHETSRFRPDRRHSWLCAEHGKQAMGAIRAAMFAPPICRRSRRNGRKQSRFSNAVVSSDPPKMAAPRRTSQRAKRATKQSEPSERSNQTGSRAPPSGRRSERPASANIRHSVPSGWLRASEEDSGFQSAIRAERAPRAEQSNPDRAPRRAEEERGDMLLVPERRRSRRAPRRDPRGASAASGAIRAATRLGGPDSWCVPDDQA